MIFLTSQDALKITGHVMHVDGGRQLTSRGHQDWYGSLHMNRLFEQDGLAALSQQLNNMVKPPTTVPKPQDPEDLFEWVEAIQGSAWSNRDENTHSRVE